MKQTSSNNPSLLDRVSFWNRTKAHGSPPTLALSNLSTSAPNTHPIVPPDQNVPPYPSHSLPDLARHATEPVLGNGSGEIPIDRPLSDTLPQADGQGSVVDPGRPETKNIATRFWLTAQHIILSSYVNVLLVFVPLGIAVKAADLSPGLIFGLNAVAIVPLAGLLSHATESVARRMGDTVGALMNVTFGNAVELIIFIALSKNEIRIVQASLLGSILANLLLILGMCFLVGGLRFREQVYNSTVTQMSACLLSLSVMSLLLPTAFHASFASDSSTQDLATSRVLKVSRGTSVVLLIVYGLYLLFQLKSHAYMYQSTPQHIIDEELAPGPVAAWMESSDSDTSSSDSSDSDTSHGSNTTAKRVKRLMRGGRIRPRRKSSASKDTPEDRTRTSSIGTASISPTQTDHDAIDFADDIDDDHPPRRSRNNSAVAAPTRRERRRRAKEQKRRRKAARKTDAQTITEGEVDAPDKKDALSEKALEETHSPRHIDFAVGSTTSVLDSSEKRPFTLRGITSNIRPQIPKTLSQNVFSSQVPSAFVAPASQRLPVIKYGVRRTNSLPDRINQTNTIPVHPDPQAPLAPTVPAEKPKTSTDDEENISRTTAVFLLLTSTALVAVCAEFMVDSINAVVSGTSGLSEAFVGLILLPIVGNAAEHVTAVTVAAKNKMDLAIGVAVGSSIQIALFVTPFIVLLGWAMSKEMSLYFTLFETVSLFVSAFIVNFLVLDGRSNYLEGSLLCAAYVIIAVAAFFYPNVDQQSNLGGNADAERLVRSLIGG